MNEGRDWGIRDLDVINVYDQVGGLSLAYSSMVWGVVGEGHCLILLKY